jgi:hypothetical protein
LYSRYDAALLSLQAQIIIAREILEGDNTAEIEVLRRRELEIMVEQERRRAQVGELHTEAGGTGQEEA